MTNQIVADGARRHFLGRRALDSQSIEENFAKELATATPEKKREIYERMADETMRHRKMLDHKPSAKALW
jgi:hypothetical protein